jgi:hypothetical protein
MAKRSLGLGVLSCGAIVGLVTGGTFGLVIAAACLVVGVLIFADGDNAPKKGPLTQGLLLVLVKELHARPIRNGKFYEISDPNEAMQFELFAHCWLVSKASFPVSLAAVQLRLTEVGNSVVSWERVEGDFENWRLAKFTEEEDSMGIRCVKTAREEMQELNVADALLTGLPREGWLHYRVQNISPSELNTASIEVAAIDQTGHVHHGSTSGPRVIPGRVWPFAQASAQTIAAMASS